MPPRVADRSLPSTVCQMRRPGLALELVAAIVVAAGTSAALQHLVSRLDSPVPSNVPATFLTAGCALVLAVLVGIVLLRHPGAWTRPLAWAGLSALTTLALALPLHATRYYLGGISIDQSFRTQFLTRLTASPELADMNYADTPPFYPAAWFWVGGRLAALLGAQGWEFYKPYAIATMAVTAAVAFVLWARVQSQRTALVLTVVTAIVGLRFGAPEPYTWMLAATLPPIAIQAWQALSAGLPGTHPEPGPQPARTRWILVGVGLYLGLSGAVYTLYFGFTALLLVGLAFVAVVTVRVTSGTWQRAPRVALVRLAGIAAVATPLVLLVWGPYLLAALRAGFPVGAAARYLPAEGAVLPVPMVDPSVLGVLCLAGTVWLVLASRGSREATPLAILALLCYGWYALSTLALVARTTLLAFRFEQLVVVTLAVSGVLALADGLRRLPETLRPRRLPLAVAVAGLLAAVSLVQSVPTLLRGYLDAAYADYYSTGTTATGRSNPFVPGAWYDEVIATIDDLTAAAPSELVVLTADYGLMSLRPYRGFQQLTPNYANPLATFDDRRAEVARWAEAEDPADLAARLDNSPYRAPAVFVLRRKADGLHAVLSRDVFPASPNIEFYDVVFREGLFVGPQFDRRNVGPFVVIAVSGPRRP